MGSSGSVVSAAPASHGVGAINAAAAAAENGGAVLLLQLGEATDADVKVSRGNFRAAWARRPGEPAAPSWRALAGHGDDLAVVVDGEAETVALDGLETPSDDGWGVAAALACCRVAAPRGGRRLDGSSSDAVLTLGPTG